MIERDHARRLVERWRADPAFRWAVITKHADSYTSGVPDISVSLNLVSWWELKVFRGGDDERRWGREVQRVSLLRYERAQVPIYCVVFTDEPRTYVVPPGILYSGGWREWAGVGPFRGWDYQAVIDLARGVHLVGPVRET